MPRSDKSVRLPASPTNLLERNSSLLLFAAEAALITGLMASVLAIQSGMLTVHMSGHILAMNIAAPALAWLCLHQFPPPMTAKPATRHLVLSTTLQLSVFFLWHSPLAMAAAMQSFALSLAMLTVLLAVSTWFWTCVIEAARQNRMEVIAALLITGKLVCLVAVLLVFAPRLIYPGATMQGGAMADQQLAGLLMLSVCPLTYVGASIYVFAKWLAALSSPPTDRGKAI